MDHNTKIVIPLGAKEYQAGDMDEKIKRSLIHNLISRMPISELEKVFKIKVYNDLVDEMKVFQASIDPSRHAYNNREANKNLLEDLGIVHISGDKYRDSCYEQEIALCDFKLGEMISLIDYLIENLNDEENNVQ